MIRLRSLATYTIVLSLLLASCSPLSADNTVLPSSGKPGSEQDDRGVLRLAHDLSWGGAESLDPSSTSPLRWATRLLYNGLTRPGEGGLPTASLASSWKPNDTSTEWSFELVTGVTFHDGSAFDAHDVKYTFERIANSDTSPMAAALSTLELVRIIDDFNLTFVLSEPAVDFPLILTDRRMRVLSSESAPGIGTGPFKVDTFDPSNTTVFSAHDDYFLGRPQLAAVEVVAIPDTSGRIAAVEAGRLDLLSELSADDVEFLIGRPGFDLQQVASGDWRGLVFDRSVAPYDDQRVVRALKLLIDREEMIRLVAGGPTGAAQSCDSPLWSGDQYHSYATCPSNLERARSLLNEAGYGDGLDITVTTSSLYSDWIPMVEVFQYQAARAGVRVTIEVVEPDGYWSNVWMQRPATTTSWAQRTAEQILTEAFLSDAAWNESRWNNSRFDGLVRDASIEPDAQVRAQRYRAAVELIRNEGGTIIPYHVIRSRVVSTHVTGVEQGVDEVQVPWHLVSVASG